MITTSNQIIVVELDFELPTQNRSGFAFSLPLAPNSGASSMGEKGGHRD